MQSRDDREYADADETILSLANGFKWVELKSADALACEGQLMRHCLGARHFVPTLAEGARHYYSLRCLRNLPHVTLVTCRNRLIVCSGKANSCPAERYVAAIHEFVEAQRLLVCCAVPPLSKPAAMSGDSRSR